MTLFPERPQPWGTSTTTTSCCANCSPVGFRRTCGAPLSRRWWKWAGWPPGGSSSCPKQARGQEPELVSHDAWGRRVDEIRVPPAWKEYARVAAEHGLVAIPYERSQGPWSRLHQFALLYLFAPSSSVYTCPLAMSDGAAKTLRHHRATRLIERAVPQPHQPGPAHRLDVGAVDDGAHRRLGRRPDRDGSPRRGRAAGVCTARSGSPPPPPRRWRSPWPGPRATRPAAAAWRSSTSRRRSPGGRPERHSHPPAEGQARARACWPPPSWTSKGRGPSWWPGPDDGVKAITPMLQITRLWNAVCAVSSMRRGMALARDYARRREAFGAPLSGQAAARGDAGRAPGRARGRLPPALPRGGAARARGDRRGHATRSACWRASSSRW